MGTTCVRQHVKAPRARVYRALLDPRAVAAWRVPAGMTSHVHAFEARAEKDGHFVGTSCLPTPRGDFVVLYEYRGGVTDHDEDALARTSIQSILDSAGGAVIAPNVDRVRMFDPAVQPDCSVANKFISQDRGPSPGGPVSITLTYNACDKARSKVHISDVLPAGMRYVPGSGRWSGAPGTPLTDGDELYNHPKHPYTRALLTAVPVPDPQRARQRNIEGLVGEIPSPINPPSGCAFRTRCRFAIGLCAEQRPPLENTGTGLVACHRWKELELAAGA